MGRPQPQVVEQRAKRAVRRDQRPDADRPRRPPPRFQEGRIPFHGGETPSEAVSARCLNWAMTSTAAVTPGEATPRLTCCGSLERSPGRGHPRGSGPPPDRGDLGRAAPTGVDRRGLDLTHPSRRHRSPPRPSGCSLGHRVLHRRVRPRHRPLHRLRPSSGRSSNRAEVPAVSHLGPGPVRRPRDLARPPHRRSHLRTHGGGSSVRGRSGGSGSPTASGSRHWRGWSPKPSPGSCPAAAEDARNAANARHFTVRAPPTCPSTAPAASPASRPRRRPRPRRSAGPGSRDDEDTRLDRDPRRPPLTRRRADRPQPARPRPGHHRSAEQEGVRSPGR